MGKKVISIGFVICEAQHKGHHYPMVILMAVMRDGTSDHQFLLVEDGEGRKEPMTEKNKQKITRQRQNEGSGTQRVEEF